MKTARLAIFLCFLFVYTGLAYTAGPHLQSQGNLEKISMTRLSDRLEVTLQLTQPTKFSSFVLTGPNRLVFDLFQTDRYSNSSSIDVNAFGVKKIRTAINRPGVIRVVFDLLDQSPRHKIWEEDNSIKIEFLYELKAELVEPKKVIEKPRMLQAIPVTREVTKEVTAPTTSRSLRMGFGLQGGFFLFKSDELKDFFGTGPFVPGGEIGVELPVGQINAVAFLCSFKFIRTKGQGEYLNTMVKLSNSPVSFNLLFLREAGKLMPFAGIGLDYNYYRLTYPEGHPAIYLAGVVWGGNIQVGTNVLLSPKLRIKIVYIYHAASTLEGDFDVVLSGSEFTVSMSYWFGL